MKPLPLVPLLIGILAISGAYAQEPDWGVWAFQPRISLGKLLPGTPLERQIKVYQPFMNGADFSNTTSQYRYEGTALAFGVRAHPGPMEWLAVMLGGGITWYYGVDQEPVYEPFAASPGVGEQLVPVEFMVFPLTLGVQAVYPEAGRGGFMVFAGVDGTVNFVSGDVPMDQQVKPGFGVVAGFAVKIFEAGFRYDRFSDLSNLGGYLAFRLNPFDVRLFGEEE